MHMGNRQFIYVYNNITYFFEYIYMEMNGSGFFCDSQSVTEHMYFKIQVLESGY